MKLLTLPLGAFQTNCYIVYNDQGQAFLVDPGAEYGKIKACLDDHKLNLEFVLITHAHADHIGALKDLLEDKPVPVYLYKEELETYKNPRSNLSAMIPVDMMEEMENLHLVDEDSQLSFSGKNLKFIHCPGHTPGGMSIYYEPLMFTGDTLFQGSIGRTDFPLGNYEDIIASCHKICDYPEDTILLPGHGPKTKVTIEKAMNPFLR